MIQSVSLCGCGISLHVVDCGLDQISIALELSAAHGALVLRLNHTRDAWLPKNVRTVRDDWFVLVQALKTNGAIILRFETELQHVLEGLTIFWRQRDDTLRFQKFHEIGDPFATQLPMITDLAQAQKHFEKMAVRCLGLAWVALLTTHIILQDTLSFSAQAVVLFPLVGQPGDLVDILRQLGQAKIDKGHFFATAQAYAAHESLKNEVGVGQAGFERANENVMKDFGALEAAGESNEAYERLQVFERIDDGCAGKNPAGTSQNVKGSSSGFGSCGTYGMSFIEDNAAVFHGIQP